MTIADKEAGFAILNHLHGAKPVDARKHAQPKPVAKQPEPEQDEWLIPGTLTRKEYERRQAEWLRIDNDLLFREV